MTVNLDANQLLQYLEDESKDPQKILKKVLTNMKKHRFTEEQV
jgi:hypothetical protein